MKTHIYTPQPLRHLGAGMLTLAWLCCAASAEEREQAAPLAEEASGPSALSIMQRASDHLAKAQQISVKAETCQELLAENGMMVQTTKDVEIRLRRPDRLRVSISTSRPSRSLWYDGKSLVLYDHRGNFYGSTPTAADKVDAMIADVERTLGVVFPLDDLALPKPFVEAASSATSSLYLGLAKVMGKVCHHVAFQHEAIDWQAWVEDGPKPLLRKLVITYKLDEGAPQYIAHFTEWDTSTELPDFLFAFQPPVGASEIQMLPAAKEGSGKKSQE